MVLKAGETFNYFGKTYTYVGESNNPDYIEVKDANGNGMSIPRESLMRNSLWSFEPDKKVLAEYDRVAEEAHNEKVKAREEASDYQKQTNANKREVRGLREQLLSMLRSWGVINETQLGSEQKGFYAAIQEKYISANNSLSSSRDAMYAARMDATAAGNREQSTLLDKFLYLT